jgi:YjbR
MSILPAGAREFALALPDASEKPHFDRVAFRTPRRIFATLAGDGSDINLMFDPDLQAHYCAMAPEAFAPVAGGWGDQGATRCDLKKVDAATLKSALLAAHTRASAPSRTKKK